MADKHLWRAHYSDGTALNEYDEAGQSHGFAEVDQSRLVGLEFVSSEGGARGIFVKLESDARPILFRNKRIHFNAADGSQWQGETITVLGFQKTIRNKNVKAMMVLYEDGSVLLTEDVGFLYA